MPFDSIKIEQGLPSNLADTLVDVVPALGHVWIICTDKVYLYDYHESIPSRNQAILAYTLTPSGLERISCAIGYNGYLYIGTTQPDHALNARIIRLAPNGASVTSLTSNDGTFLTGTNDLAVSTATANEHTWLGLAVIGGCLVGYYQAYYNFLGTGWHPTTYLRAADGASWSTSVILPGTGGAQIPPLTHVSDRHTVLAGGDQAGMWATQSSTESAYAKIEPNGGLLDSTTAYGHGSVASYVNIARLPHRAFAGIAGNTFIEFPSSNGNLLSSQAIANSGTEFWYEGYGNNDTLSPALIDATAFYGGASYNDTLLIGLKLTEDDGGGSDTVRHLLVYREPDGNWVVGESLAETGTLYAPKYTAYLNGKLRVIAPHVDENNFSIITPDAATGRWLTRRGL